MVFTTVSLPAEPDTIAPDGAAVRILGVMKRGSMAHFELAAEQTSLAIRHRTVDEVWLFLSGLGEMWRKYGEHEEVVEVRPMLSVTIPVGTHFQFRAWSGAPLTAVAVTMPQWPGEDEAVPVTGYWDHTEAE